MPHIVVKIAAGRSEALKQELAEALANTAMEVAGVPAEALSVAIEDVPREDWIEEVFLPEIRGRKDYLYKKPGYREV